MDNADVEIQGDGVGELLHVAEPGKLISSQLLQKSEEGESAVQCGTTTDNRGNRREDPEEEWLSSLSSYIPQSTTSDKLPNMTTINTTEVQAITSAMEDTPSTPVPVTKTTKLLEDILIPSLGKCHQESITYLISCVGCAEVGTSTQYWGESGCSGYQRTLAHL
jgi:hypothetical protein